MKILKNNKKKNNFPIHPTPKGSGLSWGFFRKKYNQDITWGVEIIYNF